MSFLHLVLFTAVSFFQCRLSAQTQRQPRARQDLRAVSLPAVQLQHCALGST